MGLTEYEPGTAFPGVVGRRPEESAYQAAFPFTGTLHTVTIDLSGDLITDSGAEMRIAMARQ
jgi:hypothetical protein